jgi:HSP20 family protein
MNLIRYQWPEMNTWSPFDRLASFRDEINRLFDAGTAGAGESSFFSGWSPTLDMYDEKDRFLVSVELPGMKKDEINLSFQDGVLTVSGERKHEREGQEGETFRSERYFGKFQRSVSLPASVDAAKIGTTYKDGVLMIELPKAEEAKPKQIQVNVS